MSVSLRLSFGVELDDSRHYLKGLLLSFSILILKTCDADDFPVVTLKLPQTTTGQLSSQEKGNGKGKVDAKPSETPTASKSARQGKARSNRFFNSGEKLWKTKTWLSK